MLFYEHLYVSHRIKHPNYIKWRLQHNAGSLGVYVVMLSGDPLRNPGPGENQIEFVHNAFLQQKYYKENPPYVIGLCAGRWDAIMMCADLVQEALDATGRPNVRAFLFPDGEVRKHFVNDRGKNVKVRPKKRHYTDLQPGENTGEEVDIQIPNEEPKILEGKEDLP